MENYSAIKRNGTDKVACACNSSTGEAQVEGSGWSSRPAAHGKEENETEIRSDCQWGGGFLPGEKMYSRTTQR